MNDDYTTLGIKRGASSDEIKKAYRSLAQKHHPDKGGDAEQFKKINAAYDALKNVKASGFYDIGGESMDGAFDFDFRTYEDILNKNKARTKRETYFTDVEVSDAFIGGEKTVWLDGRLYSVKYPPGIRHNALIDIISDGGVDLAIHAHIVSDKNIHVEIEPVTFNVKTFLDLEIPPLMFIIGGFIEVTCVDGGKVSVRIPEGFSTNKMLKVGGRGYWSTGVEGRRGDLLLRPSVKSTLMSDISNLDLKELSVRADLELSQRKERAYESALNDKKK